MRRRDFVLPSLVLAATARGGRGASNQTITVVYQALGGIGWPIYIAKEGGSYAKYGLDVHLELVPYPGAITMLLHDQAAIAISGLQQVLPTQINDHSLAATACWMNRSTFALIGRSEIPSVGGLRHKRIAVSQIGDSTYGYLLQVLAKFGLSANDVDMVPVGADPAGRAAALTSGRAEATLLSAPASFRMEDAGYRNLANFADHDDIFTSAACWVRKEELASNGRMVECLIRAHTEAVHRFYTDKDFALQAYSVYDKQTARADVGRSWELFNKSNIFERVPYVLKGAVAATAAQSGVAQSSVRQADLADFRSAVDNSIVDRLSKQGFFLKVFGSGIQPEVERKASQAFR